MTEIIETVEIADTWLYNTLSTDGPLAALVGDRISGTLSGNVLPTPYVTFLCESSVDVTGNAGARISTDNLYAVKAVAQTASWDDVLPIAKRLSTLLHRPGQVMQVTGKGSLTCTRERMIQYPEVDEGVQYRHLGAIYRIRASADQ